MRIDRSVEAGAGRVDALLKGLAHRVEFGVPGGLQRRELPRGGGVGPKVGQIFEDRTRLGDRPGVLLGALFHGVIPLGLKLSDFEIDQRFARSGVRFLQLSQFEVLGGEQPLVMLALNRLHTGVRGHHDDGVFEIHGAAFRVRQPAVVENLQEDVPDLRMRLLDLIEEDHRVGLLADRFGQLSAFAVSHVGRRRADQTDVGVFFHELRHVEADVGFGIIEQEAREFLHQMRFPDAGGSDEEEFSHRPIRVSETGLVAPNRVRQRQNRAVLIDHALGDFLLHLQVLGGISFAERQLPGGNSGQLREAALDHLGRDRALPVDDFRVGGVERDHFLDDLRDLVVGLDRQREGGGDALLEKILLRGAHRGRELTPALADVERDRRAEVVGARELGRRADELEALAGIVLFLRELVGQLRGGVERVVFDFGVVNPLVVDLRSVEHLLGLLDRRFLDQDLLEAALQRLVGVEELLPLLVRRRSQDRKLSVADRNLQGVQDLLPGRIQSELLDFIEHQDDAVALARIGVVEQGEEIDQREQRSDRVLRGEQAVDVEFDEPAAAKTRDVQMRRGAVGAGDAEAVGVFGVFDQLRHAFADRGLSGAGGADEHHAVDAAAGRREHRNHALLLRGAPDDRVVFLGRRRLHGLEQRGDQAGLFGLERLSGDELLRVEEFDPFVVDAPTFHRDGRGRFGLFLDLRGDFLAHGADGVDLPGEGFGDGVRDRPDEPGLLVVFRGFVENEVRGAAVIGLYDAKAVEFRVRVDLLPRVPVPELNENPARFIDGVDDFGVVFRLSRLERSGVFGEEALVGFLAHRGDFDAGDARVEVGLGDQARAGLRVEDGDDERRLVFPAVFRRGLEHAVFHQFLFGGDGELFGEANAHVLEVGQVFGDGRLIEEVRDLRLEDGILLGGFRRWIRLGGGFGVRVRHLLGAGDRALQSAFVHDDAPHRRALRETCDGFREVHAAAHACAHPAVFRCLGSDRG